MLEGVDPLLIITFYNYGILDFFNPISEIGDASHAIPIPIPIYLSERATGIYVDNETRSIDVTTRIDPITSKNPITQEVESPVISQTAVDSQLTVNLLCKQGTILLTAIIALMEQIVDRLVSDEYSISYLNGSTAIFGALLHRFGTSIDRNTNLVKMELVLCTAAKETPTAKAVITSIPKVTAPIPLAAP